MRAVYCNSMVTHALYILDTGAFTTIDVVIVFTYSAVNWRNLAVLITSHSYKAADWFASHSYKTADWFELFLTMQLLSHLYY